MPPFAYLFILAGAMLIRQVAVGRAADTPGDLRDLSLAFVHGDTAEIGAVLARRGENVPTEDTGSVASGDSSVGTSALLTETTKLGTAAKGYRWGGIGPDYYDCSGLVWRAMRNIGVYKGARFNTAVFGTIAAAQGWEKVSVPQAGDVIVWAGKHMGVSGGGDRMYSARNPAKGINWSSVSGDSGPEGFNRQPTIYRIT